MTERWKNLHGKSHNKWVMCPTCRQHTENGNVAFVDDMHTKSPDASVSTFRSSEASVNVKGSYSTKVYVRVHFLLFFNNVNQIVISCTKCFTSSIKIWTKNADESCFI